MCCHSSFSVPVGKTDITWMMLDAGAETDVVNSVGRTAAQMAAFVGTSGCDVSSFTQESSVLKPCIITLTKMRALHLHNLCILKRHY